MTYNVDDLYLVLNDAHFWADWCRGHVFIIRQQTQLEFLSTFYPDDPKKTLFNINNKQMDSFNVMCLGGNKNQIHRLL